MNAPIGIRFRFLTGTLMSLVFGFAQAQVHATQSRSGPRVQTPMSAKTLTPQDCAAFARQPHPMGRAWLRSVCEDTNFTFGTMYAKQYGMPRPSQSVIGLPAHGSADAKSFGVACMGGLAMRRLQNGWEQLRDRSGNYQRCRDL